MADINYMQPVEGVNATKTFTKINEKWEKTKSYTAGKYFRGHTYQATDLKQLFTQIKTAAGYNVFMICGGFVDGIDKEAMVRRKRDNKDKEPPTIIDRDIEYLPIDIDGFDIPKGMTDLECIEYFIRTELPKEFHNVSYIYQFSASHGIVDTEKLNVHLFFWLEKAVNNLRLKEWSDDWGERREDGRAIDSAIYVCTQPFYIQNRICLNGIDPIETLIDLVSKDSDILSWEPDLYFNELEKSPIYKDKKKASTGFNIANATKGIVSGENFHENVRGLALSMMNANAPARKIVEHIKGIMEATDVRDDRWQERYDDIERLVNTARDIVDVLTFDELVEWIRVSDERDVMVEFAGKVLGLNPIEVKMAVSIADKKLKVGPQVLNRAIKQVEEEREQQKQEYARKKRSEERKAQGIREIQISPDNIGHIAQIVAKVISKTKKEPRVFKLGTNITIISKTFPKTVRQCKKKDDQQADYPELPIAVDISNTPTTLLRIIEKNCVFVNHDGKVVTCPDKVLHGVNSADNIDWAPLSGIVEHPFVDDNWNIIQESGYNNRTGLYTELHHKLKITLMDPKEAYQYLAFEVFDEFPFASDLDRAAAVGCLLTSVQRPSITSDDGFPGFAITSPTQSSGKTTLAQLISYAAFNRPIAATSWANNDEELGKHMLGILREGHSCVLFDNMPEGKTVRSNELASAMTSDTYSRRPLGKNETETVPASVVWLFTGNNIKFVGDLASRIVSIRINPQMSDPEQRLFKRGDIGQWALDNRKKIISAVISIILNGKESRLGEFSGESRFKLWDKFVRKPLFSVSGCDLLDIFSANKLDDEELIAKVNFLELLHSEFNGERFKVGDIIKAANGSTEAGGFNSAGLELKDSIMGAFGEKATHNSVTLGKFMSGVKDRIFSNMVLKKVGNPPKCGWEVKMLDS